jgi:hypothetical protein
MAKQILRFADGCRLSLNFLSIMPASLEGHRLKRQRRLWAGAIALTALCAQYTTFLMAQPSKADKAQWNENEVTALVDYLFLHKSEAGEGGSFKMATFNAAAASIVSHHTHGPAKTGLMCKTKWTSVSNRESSLYPTQVSLQLKATKAAIEKYRNQSGVHWDNHGGAGIDGAAAENVWATYLKVRHLMRPTRPNDKPRLSTEGQRYYAAVP